MLQLTRRLLVKIPPPPGSHVPPPSSMAELSRRASQTYQQSFAPQACWKPGVDGVHMPGRATVAGTEANVARSVAFENWRHVCPAPVGWTLSKLGMSTMKAEINTEESVDATQLAALKGLNYFEIPVHHTAAAKAIGKSLMDVAELFDIPREGIVIALRVGVMYEEKNVEKQTRLEASNIPVLRNRAQPALDRVRAGSMPGHMLRSAMRFSQMNDEQLKALNLRRIKERAVSALTPRWIEAAIMHFGQHLGLECIDLLLLESLETFWEPGRSEADIEEEIVALFRHVEGYVENGMIQYYGIYSDSLVAPVKRAYPALPSDHMVPPEFQEPKTPRHIIDLGMLLRCAEKACKDGKNHHLRFVSVPMNMTEHQAVSVPYKYAPNHETFVTFARSQGITVLSHRPLETRDLQNKWQRYHRFPMVRDLTAERRRFFMLSEQLIKLEMDAKPYLERLQTKTGAVPLEKIFLGSLYVQVQRQLDNLYVLLNCLEVQLWPMFQEAMKALRASPVRELKEWSYTYETAAHDFFEARKVLMQHKHGLRALQIEVASERLVPRLHQCPILAQRALNFAASCVDVVCSGMTTSRYIHEALVLNPAKGGEFVLTPEEIKILCESEEVSYAQDNAPHPYMLEPPQGAMGEISGQRPKGWEYLIPIDMQDPKFPDDLKKQSQEELEDGKEARPKLVNLDRPTRKVEEEPMTTPASTGEGTISSYDKEQVPKELAN